MKLASPILLLSLAVHASAQTGFDVPLAGMMVDRSGSLRAVAGIAQSFVVGAALRADVLSAACARSWCLVKTATSLMTFPNSDDPGTSAPAGPALFSLQRQSALIYFPATHQFAHFEDSQLRILDWTIDGEVLALRATATGPQFAVRREDGVWIITLDGSIQAALPVETAAVLLLDGVVVYSLPESITLRREDGSEISFDVHGANSLSQLGENYVQASSTEATYVIRIDPGREQLAVLPDPGRTGAAQ